MRCISACDMPPQVTPALARKGATVGLSRKDREPGDLSPPGGQTARLTVDTDPGAESDPSSSKPHKRVNRRYLRRSWTRRSSRSILGSRSRKASGAKARTALKTAAQAFLLSPGAEQLPQEVAPRAHPLPF